MDFVPVTLDNFMEASELRPKRTQYRFLRRDQVLFTLAWSYLKLPERPNAPHLIEEDGRYIGFINIWDYGQAVNFSAFLIDRKYQGKGLGKKAIVQLIAWVKAHYPTATKIVCNVHPHNTIAHHLYESLGFRPTGAVHASGSLDMELTL